MVNLLAKITVSLLCCVSRLQADVFQMGEGLQSLETIKIGDAGNLADKTGYGGVAYPFRLSKYEVTVAQYVEFLNAKAKSDPYGLYDDNVLESSWGFKLDRMGADGTFSYSVEPEYANRPIVKVSFWDACRFANWLHNGQGDGDTETGAYTLGGTTDADDGNIHRNSGAEWFLPSENEWYKAAYYDASKLNGAGYWSFPTGSDLAPDRDNQGSNSANNNTGILLSPVTTVVGAFANSSSRYGTFDQGGNVLEWTESLEWAENQWNRSQRGGSFLFGPEDGSGGSRTLAASKSSERTVGFRVAAGFVDEQGKRSIAAGDQRRPVVVVKKDLWARPSELRKKKLIGTGQGSLHQVTPAFLANHPDFCSTFPFDGLGVIAPLDADWRKQNGLVGGGTCETLDQLAWSTMKVPDSAVKQVVDDLKRVSWGHVTDNFLWYRLERGHVEDTDLGADFTNDTEWSAVEHNAALSARICREANLKGFLLDTEQYGRYVAGPESLKLAPNEYGKMAYPMGKDSPELVRQRGRQWIKAVQAEFPQITIVIFFAWSPDLYQPEFLAGIKPFLDGVLEGIEEPGRLVHAYENTFYYGKAPGSLGIKEGFSGGRDKYQSARDSIKKWGILSSAPEKFRKFVGVGMAAWVESDPWDLWSGWPSGSEFTGWSNVPLSLAYSDEYVWVWSEHSNYQHSHLLNVHGADPDGSPSQSSGIEPGFNPFLASLSNQTFNTGREPTAAVSEDFSTDPLLNGWYFDFDMLDVGRRVQPLHAGLTFDRASVPYTWSSRDRCVQVIGNWMTGSAGDVVARQGQQRRRYVHPLIPLSQEDIFHAEFDFRVETFSADPSNPILLGLFHSDELVTRNSLALRMDDPRTAEVTLTGEADPLRLPLALGAGMKPQTNYRMTFDFDGFRHHLRVTIVDLANPSLVVATATAVVPSDFGQLKLDEAGIAQWDAGETSTPLEQAYRYRLQRVVIDREPQRWVSPRELRTKKVIGAGQYTVVNLNENDAPTPRFLAEHPEYMANHPFDGVAIPVPLDREWCRENGLRSDHFAVHEMAMTTLPIPFSSLEGAVQDLQRVSWGHVTDNFLWYSVKDGSRGGDNDQRYSVDPDSSADWKIVSQNAATLARFCRESRLQGFIMDTEMYTKYDSGELYPFGKGTPDVWRERGEHWIRAIQAEFPDIKILLFFSWGPEREAWPGYQNLTHFMNGILEGIQMPARLIHGWESTFWFGGRRNLPSGPYQYPGDRHAYANTRHDIKRQWRNWSDNPAKYDQFVEAGMAAWVESDPYNLYPGQPSGYRSELPWSNLPNTLAYSDEYVWVWCQQSHYAKTRDVLNPFLASIANQTFNTGREEVESLSDDFSSDPLQRGWYFDFNMLDIGRDKHPEFLPVMSPETVAYTWSPDNHSLRVQGNWWTGSSGQTVAQLGRQRRRFVHPIRPLNDHDSFRAEFDFNVQSFGSDPTNPIVLGLFHRDEFVNSQSVTFQISGPQSARVTAAGNQLSTFHDLSLNEKMLTAGCQYRIAIDCDGQRGSLHFELSDLTNSSVAATGDLLLPKSLGTFQCNEFGVAQWDMSPTSTPPEKAYTLGVDRVSLSRK